VHFVGLYCIIL